MVLYSLYRIDPIVSHPHLACLYTLPAEEMHRDLLTEKVARFAVRVAVRVGLDLVSSGRGG